MTISTNHKRRLEEIRKKLQSLGCKESEFLKIELLFFEVIDISKFYGEDAAENNLLAALKDVQHGQYQRTQTATRKPQEREVSIRKFIVSLRKILSGSNHLVFDN
jgi:hypothetical protein